MSYEVEGRDWSTVATPILSYHHNIHVHDIIIIYTHTTSVAQAYTTSVSDFSVSQTQCHSRNLFQKQAKKRSTLSA